MLIYDNSEVIISYKNLPVGLDKPSIKPQVILTNSLAKPLYFFIASVGIAFAIPINSLLTKCKHWRHGPSNYLTILVTNNSNADSDKKIPEPIPDEFLIKVLISSPCNISLIEIVSNILGKTTVNIYAIRAPPTNSDLEAYAELPSIIFLYSFS